MALLDIEDATCYFDMPSGAVVKAVDGVSLQIERGRTMALVGESGCGKSTLARLILRLERLRGGTIRFDGEDVSRLKRRALKRFRARVQAVFQDPYSSLNPRLRIGAIVGEPLRAHAVPRRETSSRIDAALTMVGLPIQAAKLYPHEFSGGQRQRIAIARALILKPALIILDEPISALDVSIRAQILNLLQDVQAELHLTYLVIAHDLALVEHMSDVVAVMYLGQIVEWGDSESVFSDPRHPYTQALLAAVPRPDPTFPRAKGHVTGEIASALELPSGCRFHPRCPDAIESCRSRAPLEYSVAAMHKVACHLLDAHS